MGAADRISIEEAAARAGADPEQLAGWVTDGLVELPADGSWTVGAAAQARVVSRMLDRGFSRSDVRAAARDGRLAFGYAEELFPSSGTVRDRISVAEELDLEESLVKRIVSLLGTPAGQEDQLTDDDVEALWMIKRILERGFPMVALLQLVRVYAQSLRRMAEAEVRLFHLFVHQPLVNDGASALEIAEEMGDLVDDLVPSVAPLMQYVHSRYLRFYIEQDVVGHMESDLSLGAEHPDYVQMVFCFVDLTGFTRFTEEEGDEMALDVVERFVEGVETSLPPDATIVKTIGDEVMIVSRDPGELVSWAVDYLEQFQERPRPRCGVHYGRAVYRDGDYFGGDVNLTHRLVNRSSAGEVVVSEMVADSIGPSAGLEFDSLGKVELAGLANPVELFVVDRPGGDPAGRGAG